MQLTETKQQNLLATLIDCVVSLRSQKGGKWRLFGIFPIFNLIYWFFLINPAFSF